MSQKDIKTAITDIGAGKVKSPRWADDNEEEEEKVATPPPPAPTAPPPALNSKLNDGVKKEGEEKGKDDGSWVSHEYVYGLSSDESLPTVQNYLKRQSAIPTFVRQEVVDDEMVPDRFVAVVVPRVAQDIRRQISTVAKKKVNTNNVVVSHPRLIVNALSEVRIPKSAFPNWRTHYTDSLYVRLPETFPALECRKFIESFFEMIRGKGLVEPKQYDMDIPLDKDGQHQRRCLIWFKTREAAERRKTKNPDLQIKMNNRCKESSLLFVRHLLNNSLWPESWLNDNPTLPEPRIYCDFNKRNH
jgi:hypothetical protein